MLRALVIAALAACGRMDFDAPPAPDADASPDAPPLPALVCNAQRVAIDAVAPGTELAGFHSTTGYYMMWAHDGPVTGVSLDTQLHGGAPSVVMQVAAAGVAGLIDTGQKTLVVIRTATGQAMYSLSEQLTDPTRLREEMTVASREPFATCVAETPRIWVRATGESILGAYLHDDGSLDPDGTYTAGGRVTSMSMEDGPDHSHITWTEDLGNDVSRCYASDIRYQIPMPPVPTGGPTVSDDCYDARTSSGPPSADSMIVVWRTKNHAIEARYLASTGDIMRDMSFHGRAPKVRFDGTEFWIAWIDEGPPEELHLATFDLAGNIKDVALPGWTPVGDEAFQLVRRGATVYLVILGADTLSLLLTCA